MRKLLQSLTVMALLVTSNSAAHASSTEIRAHIAAVRIIVVDNNDRVTHIYQNTDQDITPDVRYLTSEGPHLPYTPAIAEQYKSYNQKLPSLIETLYAML